MGCLKLTYSHEEKPTFLKVWKNPGTTSQKVGRLDYGARMYDPVIGRFHTVDPYADAFCSLSEYGYAGNKPILNIDVDGKYILDSKYASTYSVFYNYINNYVNSDVMGSTGIKSGLNNYSGGNLTDEAINLATTNGHEPAVVFTDAPGGKPDASGKYKQGENEGDAGTIYINTKLAKQLQDASSEDANAALFMIFVTLLHETAHYGDYLDGTVTNGPDIGGLFVEEVFTRIGLTYGLESIQDIEDAKRIISIKEKSGQNVLPTFSNKSTSGTSINSSTNPTARIDSFLKDRDSSKDEDGNVTYSGF